MQMIPIAALILLCLVTTSAYSSFSRPTTSLWRFSQVRRTWRLSMSDAETGGAGEVVPVASSDSTMGEEGMEEESDEEKYKREKLAEIKDLQAKEVFVKVDTGNWECQACGFVYSEKDGYEKRGVPKGTAFAAVENFRCPQCGAGKKYFVQETETLSGFKENLKYGLGANSLTAGQKSNLIYGGLALAVALFLSGYLLE